MSWVAPVRERGLKFYTTCGYHHAYYGRSRKGAWIEISTCFAPANTIVKVAPVRERGLKFLGFQTFTIYDSVAPVRERGLKFKQSEKLLFC